jgi:hypothetical protein
MFDQSVTENLERNLKHFIGTERYHRFHSRTVLTDGALYLAEQARCFWLMDVFASHLTEIATDHGVACLKLKRKGEGAQVVIDDGDENVLAKQKIAYTDFPLDEITLFACWSGEYWVIMLTSEY